MKVNTVQLEWNEILVVAMCGVLRRTESIRQRLQDNSFLPGWDSDISGSIAEFAFGKLANLFWAPTVNTFKKADIGKNIQIRSTRHQNGHLLVYKNDNENHLYVLMRGSFDSWECAGWILGHDAKQEQYWRDSVNPKHSCYWIPAEALDPIHLLIGDKK